MEEVNIPHESVTDVDPETARLVAVAASLAAAAAVLGTHQTEPRPKRTSPLTGELWVQDLLQGHPGRFQEQMGLSRSTFKRLSNLNHG